MRFADPQWLWLLLLVPVLGLAAWLAYRRRLRSLGRFAGGPEFADRFRATTSPHRRVARTLLLLMALTAGVLAAARPQWGTRLEETARRGTDVILLLDTSLSMAARDIPPNRLDAAKHAASSLLHGLEGDRVGLVTFAGAATLACPLTLDHEAVRLFLDSTGWEAVLVPGTALADALHSAARAFGADAGDRRRSRVVVVFSDGEDHGGGLEAGIEALRKAGVVAFAVGCGTPEGVPIPLDATSGGTGGYKKDRQGRLVTTRLVEAPLEKLARETRGRYERLTPAEMEIGEIARAISAMHAAKAGTLLRARYEERFQWPLLICLAALLAETALSDRPRRPRRRGKRWVT